MGCALFGRCLSFTYRPFLYVDFLNIHTASIYRSQNYIENFSNNFFFYYFFSSFHTLSLFFLFFFITLFYFSVVFLNIFFTFFVSFSVLFFFVIQWDCVNYCKHKDFGVETDNMVKVTIKSYWALLKSV